ncbi:hypothetical protein KSD_18770 [Ktedonobacter sp. SOSP1-85]|nr:hypothetical protein KSD_18770 [Ktedonobacter sp. SOSP1-85]
MAGSGGGRRKPLTAHRPGIFDGERKSNPYTAAVIGAVMGEDFFRTDSRSLTDALTRVVIHYTRVKWEISL